jgi:hypothetical protein
MSDLSRKDLLANNLNAMRQALPQIYNFYPKTYNLPRCVMSREGAEGA